MDFFLLSLQSNFGDKIHGRKKNIIYYDGDYALSG